MQIRKKERFRFGMNDEVYEEIFNNLDKIYQDLESVGLRDMAYVNLSHLVYVLKVIGLNLMKIEADVGRSEILGHCQSKCTKLLGILDQEVVRRMVSN